MPGKQEIIFFLSGGLSNRDPDKSLGGSPSTTTIWNGLDNLFSDLTVEQQYGFIDYRCFYIKNGGKNNWTDVAVYMANQYHEGCTIGFLGILAANEIQQFNVISDNGAIGGFFTFNIGENTNITVNYDIDIDVWASNFQTALVNIGFSGAVVTGQISTYSDKTFQIFRIEFTGENGNRNQDLITLNTNSLVMEEGDTSVLTSAKILQGSPINTEAVQVPSNISPPTNVVFSPTSKIAPIYLGTLKSGDLMPIWIKRTTQINTSSTSTQDQFIVGLSGSCSLFS